MSELRKIKEIRLDQSGNPDPTELTGALEAACDSDEPTWIVDVNGGRVAAIVPVDILEQHEQWLAGVLSTSFGGQARGGVSE